MRGQVDSIAPPQRKEKHVLWLQALENMSLLVTKLEEIVDDLRGIESKKVTDASSKPRVCLAEFLAWEGSPVHEMTGRLESVVAQLRDNLF